MRTAAVLIMLAVEAQALFAATICNNPYIPHLPTKKQAEFLISDARELLYGGAASGGKSDALLMAALQYVHVPEYRALLLRRTFKDLALPGALMDRMREWMANTDARWIASERSWAFPSGATITFGYLDNEGDKYRYQSAEFQFVGFDELTQFTESQYTYLFSRLRGLHDSRLPLRMRAATNPGGVGHAWVYRRFIHAASAIAPFIPARLEDNPHVNQAEYEEMLSRLDVSTRMQLRDGIWKIDAPGALWRREWLEATRLQRVPDDVSLTRLVVALDPSGTEDGGGDAAGIHVAAQGSDDHFYSLEDATVNGSPDAWARAAIAAYHRHNADRLIYETNYGGAMVTSTLRTVDSTVAVKGVHAKRGKALRAQPVAALAEQGRWHMVGYFPELEDELCLWVPGMPSPNRLDAMVYTGLELNRRIVGALGVG